MRLDAECRAFVSESLPPILRSWDPRELNKVAAPELIASMTPGKLRDLFEAFDRHLGTFESLGEWEGQARMNVTTQQGKVVVGRYETTARFARGPGRVTVEAVKRDEGWRIVYFWIK